MERSFLTCTRSLSQSLRYSNLSKVATRSFSTALRPTVLPQTRTRQRRCLHSTPSNYEDRAPRSLRDPPSDDNTQADFAALDVLRNTVQPATSIDACTSEGFALNNNMRIAGCGVLLVGGEAYRWRPWLNPQGQKGTVEQDAARDDAMTGRLLNAKGQWEVPDEAFADHRDGSAHHTYCAGDAEISEQPGHTARHPGYEERGGAVQLAGDGARGAAGCCGADTDWLSRGTEGLRMTGWACVHRSVSRVVNHCSILYTT
ncbi:duf498 domain-containing protein [Paraphaeosphaeria sporulosa]